MSEHVYSMTEASKLLEERTSVLRYWEEELALEIARNERGCRYYTRQDLMILISIKELKKKGLMLKEIRELIPFFYRREEAVETSQKKEASKEQQEAFFKILEKAMTELRKQNRREERYRRVDEAIRQHQLARRQVAAAQETKTKKNKRTRA
ncbi:MAG: MerR family transcriptional regulator [Lachnospiraceae bacterium]|nr:MerR family transcriptional regulator [Lachnospiraceae bacterium]